MLCYFGKRHSNNTALGILQKISKVKCHSKTNPLKIWRYQQDVHNVALDAYVRSQSIVNPMHPLLTVWYIYRCAMILLRIYKKKNSFIYRFKTGANFSFCLLRIYVEKMISKNFWDLSNFFIAIFFVTALTELYKTLQNSVGQIEKSILFMTSDMCVRHKALWYQSSAIHLFHENTVWSCTHVTKI